MPLPFETLFFLYNRFAKSYALVVFVSLDDLLRRRTVIAVVKPHGNKTLICCRASRYDKNKIFSCCVYTLLQLGTRFWGQHYLDLV